MMNTFFEENYCEDVKFCLITSLNPIEERIITFNCELDIEGINLNKDRRTIFVIHGFRSGHTFIDKFREAFYPEAMVNIIGIDWSKFARVNILRYEYAVRHTKLVGELIGEFIETMVDSDKLRTDSIQIIGHSLGAHIAGFVGKYLKVRDEQRIKEGKASIKIPLITGLDPAKPDFSKNPCDRKLCKGDAEWVEVFHTNGGQLGIYEPIGDVDFYLNKGKRQPHCKKKILGFIRDLFFYGLCSHSYAHAWYRKTLHLPKINGWRFDTLEEMEGAKRYNLSPPTGYFASDPNREPGIIYIESEEATRERAESECRDAFEGRLSMYGRMRSSMPYYSDYRSEARPEAFIVFGINQLNRNNFVYFLSEGSNFDVVYSAPDQQYIIKPRGSLQPNQKLQICPFTEPSKIEHYLSSFTPLGFVLVFDYTDLFSEEFWELLRYIFYAADVPITVVAMNMMENETPIDDRMGEMKEIVQSGIGDDRIEFELRKISAFRQIGPLEDQKYLKKDIKKCASNLSNGKNRNKLALCEI